MQDQVNHTSSQSYVWFVLLNWEKRKAEQPITKKTTRWRKQTTVDEKKAHQLARVCHTHARMNERKRTHTPSNLFSLYGFTFDFSSVRSLPALPLSLILSVSFHLSHPLYPASFFPILSPSLYAIYLLYLFVCIYYSICMMYQV